MNSDQMPNDATILKQRKYVVGHKPSIGAIIRHIAAEWQGRFLGHAV